MESQPQKSKPQKSKHAAPWNGRAVLAACSVGIAVVWCIVLPWIAERPATQQQLQFLDARGIDPSAMFYTELECMGPILEKLEGNPRRQSSIEKSNGQASLMKPTGAKDVTESSD